MCNTILCVKRLIVFTLEAHLSEYLVEMCRISQKLIIKLTELNEIHKLIEVKSKHRLLTLLGNMMTQNYFEYLFRKNHKTCNPPRVEN